MSKYVFKASTHGAQFDDDFRPPRESDRRGRQFDEFTRRPTNPHGPQSDEGFRPAGSGGEGDAFERTLAQVPARVRDFPAGCPACGHHHTVAEALRAGRTSKSSRGDVDVRKTVRETDDAFIRSGAGEPDELHEALVASIEKTYGIRSSSSTVAKSTTSRRARPAGRAATYDEALEKVRRVASTLKT